MTEAAIWLPDLVLFSDYGGDWTTYLEAIYAFFKKDFVDSKPRFPKKPVRLKRHPLSMGKEYSFWHFIQEGEVEEVRTPDFRRCERIRWPRPIIEAVETNRVKTWANRRGSHRRIVIALPDFSYVVVLEERKDYVLPWTAYPVFEAHRRRKLKTEYVEAHKTNAAP